MVLRPFVLPLLGFAGVFLAVEELKRSPLHHNTIIWVLGFGMAGAALIGGYKEVRNRLVLRRWLNADDPDEMRAALPQVKKAVAALPPWHRTRYLAKKALLEETALPRTHGPHGMVSSMRTKTAQGLANRLRASGAFILSILVLGTIGAFSFVQWLQITVSDFGNPTPWLVGWVLVTVYFCAVGSAVVIDKLRRHRRRASATQES